MAGLNALVARLLRQAFGVPEVFLASEHGDVNAAVLRHLGAKPYLSERAAAASTAP